MSVAKRKFTEAEGERLERLRIARMREHYRATTIGERIEQGIDISRQAHEFRAAFKLKRG
jgi:hypothetical protein